MNTDSTRRRIRALVALAILSGAFTPALASAHVQSSSASAEIPVVRIQGSDSGYPTPYAYVRGPGLANTLLVFDSLLWKDSTGKVVPWLAKSWEKSSDGLTWTFTLNENAKWHDGTPLTADDVAFTFDYNLKGNGKKAPGVNTGIDYITSVTATNPTTVTFKLSKLYAPFEILLAGRVPIVPKHIWSSVTDPAKFTTDKAFIGSGPYKVESVDTVTGTYKFVANNDFYLGRPKVQRIEMVPAPVGPLLGLKRGDLDAVSPANEEGVPERALKPFRTNKSFTVLQKPGEWSRVLHFNMKKGFPFNDVSFRQAVAYGVNRQDMVNRILLGQGEVASMGGLAPSNPYTTKGLPVYKYDLKKANSLLDAIGLVDKSKDGMRDNLDGTDLLIELQTSSRFSTTTANLVRSYLKKIGLNVTVNVLESTTADANAAAANYQMALIGYGGFGGDPDGLRTRFSSSVTSSSFSRVHGFTNSTFESAAAAQLRDLGELTRRRNIDIMQQEIAANVAALPLYVPTRTWVSQKAKNPGWFYTPGGVFGGYPGMINKGIFTFGAKGAK